MKKITSLLFIVPLLLTHSYVANAQQSGSVQFHGYIVSQTCTVNDGAPDLSVTLPTVPATSLDTLGKTAGRTEFNINLSECDEDLNEIAVSFEVGPNTNLVANRLINRGTASNVEVQILDSDSNPVKLNGSAPTKYTPVFNGSAQIKYYAEYYAAGSASSGTVETSTRYTVVYP